MKGKPLSLINSSGSLQKQGIYIQCLLLHFPLHSIFFQQFLNILQPFDCLVVVIFSKVPPGSDL